jgi:hypothetical protein
MYFLGMILVCSESGTKPALSFLVMQELKIVVWK